ncbi:hypothetical protein [Methanobrevibacter millerae]|uniref:Uncharacterized protein n=1 Tax=Methanobrevibacter millerae TaxID=230361 RepID=A0A1G5WZL7_9EURY|nr:hypothetical protein [Methanobrevibacter millerae]SDA63472.1 hypothetical protein SAMN02910315_01819 [Methanobrevibacter millerae]
MSEIVLRPLEEEIRNARIDGMLWRAEERGIKRGIKQKEEELIKKLLNNYSPENVSLMLECDIEKIETISHSKQPHC